MVKLDACQTRLPLASSEEIYIRPRADPSELLKLNQMFFNPFHPPPSKMGALNGLHILRGTFWCFLAFFSGAPSHRGEESMA
jgi:hypothetical protein